MRSILGFTALPAIVIGALGGCAAPPYSSDEPVSDGQGTYDVATTNTAYFEIWSDLRKCASPMCGGWFVARVNHAKTVCADGASRAECYVWNFDTTALGVTGRELDGFYAGLFAQTNIVRGDLSTQSVVGHQVGLFTATEAWQAGAATGAPEGVWVEAKDNGNRCITTPCPDMTEHKLNSVLAANIADLDFSPSGATDDEIAKAWDGYAKDGLIVVGDRYFEGKYKGRTVTQFYTRMQPSASSGPACIVTGCNGEVCAAEKVITECTWKDQYACYADATCAKQADGTCGWTDTPDLEACLESSL